MKTPMREAVIISAVALCSAGCGSTTPPPRLTVRPRATTTTTTVPVQDPSKHDTTEIDKAIHDLSTTTTTVALPRTS